MKTKIVIFYALSMLLCLLAQSCNRFSIYSKKVTPLHYSVLKTITDTMTCCPDAALDILIGVADTVDESKLSRPDYYEYQILIAEALYKNDLIQTNNSAVFRAVIYYDSLAQIYPKNVEVLFQKSRAHYYNAVGENENNDIKKACAEYLMSLKTINQIKEKDRTHNIDYFNGLIYNRLARIYYDFTNDVALSLYKKANESFIKCETMIPIVRNCNSIAKVLLSKNEYDECETYLSLADSLMYNNMTVDDSVRTKLRNGISMTRAINLCDSQNKHYEALCMIKELYDNAYDDYERVVISAVLAEMYYQNNIIDSALYYYEMAVENNHPAKMTAIIRIIDICKVLGDNEKAAYYAPLLAEETNRELKLAPLKAELVAMYEQYEAEKHKDEIRVLWLKIIMALTLGVIIITIVFSIVSIIRKRRHLDEINRKNWYIRTLHGKIKKKSVENKNANEDYVKKARQPIPFNERMQNIKRDDLCMKLYSITQMHIKTTVQYPKLVLGDNEKMHLIGLFDKELNGALQSIISNNQRLKKSDELLFCLCLIGLDDKHIAAVTGNTYHNVFVRSRKCLEILGGDDLLSSLVSYIMSFIPES